MYNRTPLAVKDVQAGHGQHGDAHFMDDEEKKKVYVEVPHGSEKTPGMLVGATRSTWLLDISDQSVLMVAPPGAGKSTSVYIPTITYNARVNHNTKNGKGVGNGASMVLVSVKDDLYTITGPELRRCGYRVLKLDLRNVFSSCHFNLLYRVNAEIDAWHKEQDARRKAVHYATAERYAKTIASAIIGATGGAGSGDNSEYFNETARGLITGLALAERQGGHCPRPFFFFLDEFGNFPAIPGVTSLFSAIRSRGGRLLVAVQSYSQFLLKYDKNVTEIIKDNCQILLNTFVSPSAQDTASSISKMLGDETILTGSTSKSDGKTTSSHQLMGRPLVSPAQMVRIERDTWIVEKAGYAPMKTHLEGYWKYLSLTAEDAIKEPESDYQEVRLLSVTDMQQALQYSADLAPAEHKSKLAANSKKRKHRNQNAELYPGKFDT